MQRANPGIALYDPLDRASFVLRESMGRALTGSLGAPLEAVLAAVGGTDLLARIRRGWRETGRLPFEGLVLLTTLVYVLGVTAFLHLALLRYLVPLLIIGALLSGLDLAAVVRWLPTIGSRVRAREPVRERTVPYS